MSFENFVTFSEVQWTLFALILMISYGAHFAFAPFFLASSTQMAPRYRIVPWLSAVVMVSAGLSLFREHTSLMNAFSWTGELWEPKQPDTGTFANAFRYGNWIITVPILLIQLPLAMKLPKGELLSRSVRMIIAGEGMILTGLYGQFFEVTDPSTAMLWAIVSTVFFIWLLLEIWGVISSAKKIVPADLVVWPQRIFWFMFVAWWIYVLASVMPFLIEGATGLLWRQGLFTVADVTSKLVYGVILSRFCIRLSAREGYLPAVEAMMEAEPGKAVTTAESR